jgi:hypothetical protein
MRSYGAYRAYERQKEIREQIKAWAKANPAQYAILQAKVKQELQEQEQREQQALLYRQKHEAEERVRRAALRDAEWRFSNALVSNELPSLDFLGGSGALQVPWECEGGSESALIAQRAWSVDFGGWLKSIAQGALWKSVMVADRVPDESNSHGLYCNTLSPVGMMVSQHNFQYLGGDNVQGIIECKGRVVQHSDGLVRAEYAEILCLVVVAQGCSVYDVRYVYMRLNYFPIPVFVLTLSQYAEFLFRVMVWCRANGVNV